MTGMYEKVLDWVNDFDHADPEYNERAHEIWEEFQGSECPVAHSERYDGLWAPFTYEMVHEIASQGHCSGFVKVRIPPPAAAPPWG